MHTRVFRFAPSPNGYLHFGHAYSALVNDDIARQCNGRLLLRIEEFEPWSFSSRRVSCSGSSKYHTPR